MVADHFERIEGSFGSSTTFFARWVVVSRRGTFFFFFFLVLSWLGAGGLFTINRTDESRGDETGETGR